MSARNTARDEAVAWTVLLDSGEMSDVQRQDLHAWLEEPYNARSLSETRALVAMVQELPPDKAARLRISDHRGVEFIQLVEDGPEIRVRRGGGDRHRREIARDGSRMAARFGFDDKIACPFRPDGHDGTEDGLQPFGRLVRHHASLRRVL